MIKYNHCPYLFVQFHGYTIFANVDVCSKKSSKWLKTTKRIRRGCKYDVCVTL